MKILRVLLLLIWISTLSGYTEEFAAPYVASSVPVPPTASMLEPTARELQHALGLLAQDDTLMRQPNTTDLQLPSDIEAMRDAMIHDDVIRVMSVTQYSNPRQHVRDIRKACTALKKYGALVEELLAEQLHRRGNDFAFDTTAQEREEYKAPQASQDQDVEFYQEKTEYPIETSDDAEEYIDDQPSLLGGDEDVYEISMSTNTQIPESNTMSSTKFDQGEEKVEEELTSTIQTPVEAASFEQLPLPEQDFSTQPLAEQPITPSEEYSSDNTMLPDEAIPGVEATEQPTQTKLPTTSTEGRFSAEALLPLPGEEDEVTLDVIAPPEL